MLFLLLIILNNIIASYISLPSNYNTTMVGDDVCDFMKHNWALGTVGPHNNNNNVILLI